MALKTLCNQHAETALLHWPQLFDVALLHISHITGPPPAISSSPFCHPYGTVTIRRLLAAQLQLLGIFCCDNNLPQLLSISCFRYKDLVECPTRDTSCRSTRTMFQCVKPQILILSPVRCQYAL